MTLFRFARPLSSLLCLIPLACGPDGGLEVSSTESAVAPAGSNAAVVSTTFPASFAPGERVNVQVVMQNTGAASPANDWDTTAYRLLRQTAQWGFGGANVTPTVAVNGNQTFNFLVTAPATSPQDFRAAMYHAASPDVGFFGDVFTQTAVPITNAQRQWDCSLVSTDMPATLNIGETRTVTAVVQNSGTQDWASGGFCLLRRDTTTFGPYCVSNNAAVAAGNQHTFTFSVTAPATPGTYNYQRQMFQTGAISAGSVGLFDVAQNCIDQTVDVISNVPNYDAAFVPAQSTIDERTNMQTGETTQVTVTFQNTGSQTWTAGQFRLYTRNTPNALWGPATIHTLPVDVASGGSHTFTFPITAPATAGNYAHRWRIHGNAPSPGFFGELLDIPVVVSDNAPPQYDASVVATSIPTVLGVNQQTNFSVTMQNDGLTDWTAASGVRLISANTPSNLWGVAVVDLPGGVTVQPGQQYEFVFNIRAPSTPGSYQTQWRLNQDPVSGGVGSFGEVSMDPVTVVQDCGNGVVDPNIGEQCDDGNVTDGDGCSSACQIELQRLDLRNGPIDRTFISNQAARGLANSAIGDVNNDGIDDLAVAHWGAATITATVVRGRAGRTFVHLGGANFFTNAAEQVDTNATTQIVGERGNDETGGGAHGTVMIGDVTGDGIGDIVVSGGRAPCIDDVTAECGRIYVLAGGALPAGQIDLAATPAPYVARFIGENAGDRAKVVAIGDVTNDGIGDLIIGMTPANGGSGEIAIIAGGGLSGTTVLSAGNRTATILAEGAADLLGDAAAVGSFGGTAANDLLIGAGAYDSATGGVDAGGAWAIFGPLSGTYDLGATPREWSVRWRGAGVRDGLGGSVDVAHVRGSSVEDVLIGVGGYRDIANTRFGSVDVYEGPIAAGSDFDLSAAAVPDARIQGEDAGDGYGHCVIAADLNRDLFEDIISVGFATQGGLDDLNQAGEMAVVLGADALADGQISNATAPLIVYEGTSPARACLYRHALSSGDLNGDGRPDICFGAPGGSEPGFPAPAPGRVDCVRNPY